MAKLKLVPTIPKYRAIITPAQNNDWNTGQRAAVIDHRNSAEVKCSRFAWRESKEAGRPVGEFWADVVINKVRLRIPLDFSDVTRHGGFVLVDRQNPAPKPRRDGSAKVASAQTVLGGGS